MVSRLSSSPQNQFVEAYQYVSLRYMLPPPTPLLSVVFSIKLTSYLVVQFDTLGYVGAHGYARNRVWSVDPNPPPLPMTSPTNSYVDLLLKPSEEDLKIWPHRYISPSINCLNVRVFVQMLMFSQNLCGLVQYKIRRIFLIFVD